MAYPPIEPYATGMLDTGDGNHICWETCGSGPGTGGRGVAGLGRRGHLPGAQRQPGHYSNRPDAAKIAFARICAHYYSRDGFVPDGALIRDAGRLAGIPGILVHRRNDLGGPVITAWELNRAWPGSELIVIEDSGHTGSASMAATLEEVRERLSAAVTAGS